MNCVIHAKAKKEQYLSSSVFKSFCEHCITAESRTLNPKAVKKGSSIFVKTDYIEEFFATIHPHIRYPYVLITHDSDDSPVKSHAITKYLDDKKLIAWFAQNVEFTHAKLHPIPIGLANEDLPHGNKALLQKYRRKRNSCKKKHLLYLNINIEKFHIDRPIVSELFSKKQFCWSPKRKPWQMYLLDLANSKFILSPRGNGLDCHRTWESLYMGSIPIVKASPMDKVFEGLPVLIVKDWTLVSEKFLHKKYATMIKKKYSHKKLFAPYWKKLINSYKIKSTGS